MAGEEMLAFLHTLQGEEMLSNGYRMQELQVSNASVVPMRRWMPKTTPTGVARQVRRGRFHDPPGLVGYFSPGKRTFGAQTIQDVEWCLLVTSSPHEVPWGTPEEKGVRRARRRSRSATPLGHITAAGARSRRASSLWSAVRYPPKVRALVQPRMARSSGSNKNVPFSRGRHLEPLEQGARARARPKPWRLLENQA